jgi:hypothetical protein
MQGVSTYLLRWRMVAEWVQLLLGFQIRLMRLLFGSEISQMLRRSERP